MLIPGLVSISFRKRSIKELIADCVRNNLRTIEWGGDVHVPHGDLRTAQEAAELTAEAGLTVSTYGSYFRPGVPEQPDFAGIAACAEILHAPTIRVWAGNQGSEECTDRRPVIQSLRECCTIAADRGLTVTLECHNNTLTDTIASTMQLLEEVNSPALRCGWQPQYKRSAEYRMEWLKTVLPYLSTVHCFCWNAAHERLALADGTEEWQHFIQLLRSTGRDIPVMLEFVRNDDMDQLVRDANTLNTLLG